MRILHVAQSISGGIASYFEEIAAFQSALYGAGNVRFLVPAGNRHHVPSIGEVQIAEFAPTQRSLKGLLAMARAARRELRDFAPTVVHLHSTFAGAVVRPAILFSGARPGVVYCPHGWVFAMELPAWKRRIFAMIERGLLPLTDRVVNISHADHALARAFGFPEGKMVTIRNGIAATPPPVPHGLASPAAAFAQDRVNLLFVGRHDRQKGLDILLDVFRGHALPGVHLHVVGAPVLATEDTAGAAALPANVTIHGWQNRDQVSAMMARADALVVPSRWEGFGLVAAEAMRMGKPVIASRRGGLAEIVADGQSGFLFDLDDRAGMAALLGSLRRERLESLGKAARARFLQSFTSDRLNAELASLYGTVSGKRTDRPARTAADRDNGVPSLGPERFGG